MNPIDRRDPLCLHDGTLIWHRKLSMKRTDPVVLLSGKGHFKALGGCLCLKALRVHLDSIQVSFA